MTRTNFVPLDRLTDAQNHVVRYGYDPNGNLASFTDARGNVTRWTCDARNRPLPSLMP
jgi:YD repeat-containing protein